MCVGTQLRQAVSNQVHNPLNAGDARYTLLRCCNESVRDCYYQILCVKNTVKVHCSQSEVTSFRNQMMLETQCCALFSNQRAPLLWFDFCVLKQNWKFSRSVATSCFLANRRATIKTLLICNWVFTIIILLYAIDTKKSLNCRLQQVKYLKMLW